MTMISRVLGLVRDVIVANLMGAGAAADVFFFANKIPNFLRRLFAEGAFSQAFVPVFTAYHKEGDTNKVRDLIAAVSGTLGLLVTIVTLLGIVGSPLITILFGAGWFVDWLNDGPDASKFELASFLLKITFPYLWFITFTALSGAILNTLGKFAVAAFTPVFLNIAIIGAALFISPRLAQPEVGLAMGVFIGGLIQFIFQIPFLKKEGMLVKPKWGWHDEGVTKIRKLMIPAMFGVSVSQINLLFDTFIASFLMTGSISWLYYSDRLLEFPLGLFGIAIATVILPALSKKYVDKSGHQFEQTLDWGIRVVLLLGIPAMLGMIALASPMLKVLFMRGEFDAGDVEMASMSLMAYGSGLLSFMLIKVLAPGYYARQDTKTPVKFGIIAMISNMVFNVILAIPFGYVGLAMATAASATLNASLLYWGLNKHGVYSISRETWGVIGRLCIAGSVMVALISYLNPPMSQWLQWGLLESGLHLLGYILIAAVSYFCCLYFVGIRTCHFKIHEAQTN